jgi:multidrug efflux pump subunit AcrB
MANKVHIKMGDNKIDTPEEMIEDQEQKLWESNPMEALRYERIETRKKLNWWARFSLSLIIVFTFLFLIWLLFFGVLPDESRDLVNIMVGAYVAVLAKATDYWFKDKDDPEQKETENIAIANGNDVTI